MVSASSPAAAMAVASPPGQCSGSIEQASAEERAWAQSMARETDKIVEEQVARAAAAHAADMQAQQAKLALVQAELAQSKVEAEALGTHLKAAKAREAVLKAMLAKSQAEGQKLKREAAGTRASLELVKHQAEDAWAVRAATLNDEHSREMVDAVRAARSESEQLAWAKWSSFESEARMLLRQRDSVIALTQERLRMALARNAALLGQMAATSAAEL